MKKLAFLFCLIFSLAWLGTGQAFFDDLTVRTPKQKSKLSFLTLNENKVLVSVLNDEGEAILGLKKDDFEITKGPKKAQIISVEDVSEQRGVGLNIVLVVDNSFSMKMRNAINPVLAALDQFLSLVRPIDEIHVISFVDPSASVRQRDQSRASVNLAQSNDPAELSKILHDSYIPDQTSGTYLYDAMQQGLKIIRAMPEKSQKFMVIFSDGEDINSIVKPVELRAAAQGLQNFTAFAVDYMDRPELDPFLQSFTTSTGGLIRKAKSADDFLPIFKQFSTTIFHRYAVSFRFLTPPTGTLTSEPAAININEITMVDSSPLLNYVYFDTGKSEIPDRYVTFADPTATVGFAEEKLTDTMEKYHQILNVIGKRLVMNPDALITIVGCNSNAGEERGNTTLSQSRANTVFAYFRDIWGIDPVRMEVLARNLPDVPSTSRVPEGVMENQRVEIYSNHPAILDTINSTYMKEDCDTREIRLTPAIQAETVIESWQLKLMAGDQVILTREGKGNPPPDFVFGVNDLGGVHRLETMPQLSASLEVKDNEGNVFTTSTETPTKINFLKREERIAQKLESKVIEKYGLILFDFDRADLKGRNQVIVNRVATRMASLPAATMDIIGHTDFIGKEDYNTQLSSRRASSVYGAILETGMAVGANINYQGLGPNDPPYDNTLPEGRALNRTVIITIQYSE